jgi:AraC-like DNA-binding protein
MLATSLPSKRLRELVSHYWLGLNNADPAYPVLPDGAIDVVIEVHGAAASSFVYGTTTIRTDVPLHQRSHYLGVRFKPGQSRHFLAAAASELTDAREDARGLLSLELEDLPERISSACVFARFDELLRRHVARHQPIAARIDDVIRLILSTHGATRIDDAAAVFGKSRRQFERVFLTTVGVSAKRFARITRFRRASELLARSLAPLASIALQAGYADQSHMNHDFRRLAGMSPAAYARSDVEFLQDQMTPTPPE